MVDSIVESLLEVLVYWLFQYPGALIKWVFLRKKRTLKDILKNDGYSNGSIGFLTAILIVAAVMYFIDFI